MKRRLILLLSVITPIVLLSKGEAKPFEKAAIIKQGNEAIEIHLDKNKTQGYLNLYVKSKGRKEPYWKINLNYFDGGIILLGQVPDKPQAKRGGGKVTIRQTKPQGRPVFPSNKKLTLYVSYRDDIPIAPGASYTAVSFELDDDGRLKKAAGQGGADQPATDLESKGSGKPETESDGRSQ